MVDEFRIRSVHCNAMVFRVRYNVTGSNFTINLVDRNVCFSKWNRWVLAIAVLVPAVSLAEDDPRLFRRETRFPAMGVEIRVVAYTEHLESFNGTVAATKLRVSELNSVFSNYIEESEVAKVSNAAPNQVQVSLDLWRVAGLSDTLFRVSNGAFDPTIGAVTKLWRMARRRNRLPNDISISRAMQNVGWQENIFLDPTKRSLAARSDAVALDFGGVAKGYTADQIIAVFKRQGMRRVFADVGGDIAFGEAPPGALGWSVAVEVGSKPYPKLRLSNCGVATSGDAKQNLQKNGVRHSHILDPRTGQAMQNGHTVVVVCESCAKADGYASALSVLEPEVGMKLAKTVPNFHCRIETVNGADSKVWTSNQFDSLSESN